MQFAGNLRGAQVSDTTASPSPSVATNTAMAVILAISFSHMLNDIMQSLLSAIYPMLKDGYRLDFWQIGMLTLTFQVTASLFQPLVGIYTDKRPLPYSLPFGMGSTLIGLVVLAYAGNYWLLLTGAAFIGFGSAVFHPEASRVARMASGGRYGLAQSLFQVGGNFGQSIGPLLAAFIVVPLGQGSVAWFSLAALLGMGVLWQVSNWYSRNRVAVATNVSSAIIAISRSRLVIALLVLVALTFSKNVYMASISSYYTFYLIEKFGVSVQDSQVFLFLFLFAAALGTVIGGPIGDRYGAKFVIWLSIVGAVPFTLALPYVDSLFWTAVLSFAIGVIMASSFPAIVVFAQELLPGRVGMVAGVFFGFAFGIGGIAAAVLGILADTHGIDFVYMVCSYLPLLGLLTIFLPKGGHRAVR
ncbi:MFS transporter [Arvimicrobium flavum]|uniref:MFS transporter n=1 Tax=Arvimicrobium flavum TaxID=3393320 RepID=UPI00398D19AD